MWTVRGVAFGWNDKVIQTMVNGQALVAVLDVLGVKSMIANCSKIELQYAAEAFSSAIARARTLLREEFMRVASPDLAQTIGWIWDKLVFKSFSDTLVVVLLLDDKPSEVRGIAIDLFFANVSQAVHDLFYAGFPVRCGIDYGHVVMKDDFILGRAFMVAFELSERMQCIGAAMTHDAYAVRATVDEGLLCQSVPAYEMLIPVKGGTDELLHCIDWAVDNEKTLLNCADIRQHIYNECRAYHKTIGASAMAKIENTERVLREFVFRQSKLCF